jgi:adenylosuccinate lyase
MINSVHISDSSIYGSAWTTPELRALFSEQAKLRGWLEVMAVLAETQAADGLIPAQAALDIRACYEQLPINEGFLAEIGAHYAASNHSLLGFIKAVQARCSAVGGEWLCYGATVQDITDTHTMRVLKTVREQFIQQITDIERCLIKLARQHQYTIMAGRTHGQIGLPITFGYKAATWLDEMDRHRQRLLNLAERMDVGQLAGGVGSLSSYGDHPLTLQAKFCAALQLKSPSISWISSRDRYAEWANVLAMLTATIDRIGHEIYNCQRLEIGELSEGFTTGTVGSITMPQKRNPELSEHLGTIARLVRHQAAFMNENLVHDHERDGRSWKGEWLILPEITLATGKALQLIQVLLNNLQVHSSAMRNNLALSNGFIFSEAVMLALAKRLGKQSAHSLVYELAMLAQSEQQSFQQVLEKDLHITALLSNDEIQHLCRLENCIGACADMVDQLIASLDLPQQNS